MEKNGTLRQKRRPKGYPNPQKGPLKGTQLGTVQYRWCTTPNRNAAGMPAIETCFPHITNLIIVFKVMNFIGFSGRQRSFHIQVEAECIWSHNV